MFLWTREINETKQTLTWSRTMTCNSQLEQHQFTDIGLIFTQIEFNLTSIFFMWFAWASYWPVVIWHSFKYDSMALAISSNRFKSLCLLDFLLWSMSTIFQPSNLILDLDFYSWCSNLFSQISLDAIYGIGDEISVCYFVMQRWTILNNRRTAGKVLQYQYGDRMTIEQAVLATKKLRLSRKSMWCCVSVYALAAAAVKYSYKQTNS